LTEFGDLLAIKLAVNEANVEDFHNFQFPQSRPVLHVLSSVRGREAFRLSP
jgi:hypothetical protein